MTETGALRGCRSAHRRRSKNQRHRDFEVGCRRRGVGGVRALTERAETIVAARGCRPSDTCARDSPRSVCRSRFDTILKAPQGGIE